MGHRFAEIAFTESVRNVQVTQGSRSGYAAMDDGQRYNHELSEREQHFIAERDSFYMATVSETGWPYVQHRGGPPGFLKVLDAHTLGFADFRGNRQYVSVGNLQANDRVSLILMDYPNQRRLKLLGCVRLIGDDDPDTLASLELDDYRAPVERGFVIHVEAFDWNCPQYITPRYTVAESRELLMPPDADIETSGTSTTDASTAASAVLGDGPLELEVIAMRQITPRVRSYDLRRVDGKALTPVEPGAHLQVPVPPGDGRQETRTYSIVTGPESTNTYTIAVARDDQGRGGSVAIHQYFALGTRLRCGMPKNEFVLHEDARPAVLIAGGIGITPLLPMARVLATRDTPVELHFAGREHAEMAFLSELRELLGDRLHVYSSADGKRMDVTQVVSRAPKDALVYLCGPARLVDAVKTASVAAEIPLDRVRTEHFDTVPPPDAQPVQVELRRSGLHLDVTPRESILDAMLDAGVEVAYSCRAGNCRTCSVGVLDGTPDHRDSALTEDERNSGRLMLPCVSRAHGQHLVLDV